MLTASEIVDALGGTSKVATALGGLTPSTVHGWRVSNSIPEWRRPALLALALDLGVSLGTADFPASDQRTPRKRQAA